MILWCFMDDSTTSLNAAAARSPSDALTDCRQTLRWDYFPLASQPI
jgi:hypothetical protein